MTDGSTVQIGAALGRLVAGDPAARDELLARTADRLRRLAGRTLRVGFPRVAAFEQTDDVIQSVMLRLLRGWDGVVEGEGGVALDAAEYLCRVSRLLREVLLDLARKHFGSAHRRPPVPLDDDMGSDTLDPAALAAFTDFHTAVEELPDHLRRVVDLHWYQELTHAEVRGLLGIGESTSRKYWVEARVILARKLGGNPFR
jgi:DNA-directed RNA polymerase specialized sigma24 family protein